MRAIRHPLSGNLYDLQPDGTIRVEHQGNFGIFRFDGTWISGEVFSADPQLCGWIGGRELPSRHRQAAQAAKDKESK